MIPDELMRKYRDSIPDKLQTIARLIKDFELSPTQEHLAALRMAVHHLAGSAGTYGYPEASRLCKNLESKILKDDLSTESLTLFYEGLKKSLS